MGEKNKIRDNKGTDGFKSEFSIQVTLPHYTHTFTSINKLHYTTVVK